jgi:hypothetical protein
MAGMEGVAHPWKGKWTKEGVGMRCSEMDRERRRRRIEKKALET